VEERLRLRPRFKNDNGRLFLNYTANFIWINRCRGSIAAAIRLRGAALKAFAEVGLSSAVRAVLVKALDPSAAGVRAELDPNAGQLEQLVAAVSQAVTQMGSHRQEIKDYVDAAIGASRESSVVEITRQGAASSLRKEEELRSVCRQLPGGAEGSRILREYGHLPVSSYLEQKLAADKKHVIRCFMPVFSKELQEQRLELAETNPNTEKPFMNWANGGWRVTYFEADRDMMDSIFDMPDMKVTLSRMLRDQVPAGGTRVRRATTGGTRRGPYQGSSSHANPASVRSFFGVPDPTCEDP